MGAFKKYFDYKMMICGCGIPYIILEGTADDYKEIISKAKQLSKYDFDWYIKKIIPHIEKMVEAKEGKVDADYFKNIIHKREETQKVWGLSGIYKGEFKFDYISGWILNFFAYFNDGRVANFKNEEVLAKFRQLLEELKAAFEKYNPALNSFNEVTNNLFDTVSQSGNSFSNFIEEKMLEKIKQIPGILNEGISAIPQTSKSINKFNEEIKKKEGDTQKEREDKYDEILIKVLNMTRKVDNQVFNSSKSIENDFKTLEEKVSNVKKDIEDKGNSYNEYVKILKDEGKKIIDIVNEIRKLFDKGPVSIKFDDKDIEFPFYEYAKRLNKGFEKIEEIKEEVQKPMKLVMVVLGDQINTVTLDLLFIMDITESMQDLLDETRDSIKYILDKIKRDSPGIDVRFAYEGYRDFADLKEGQKYYTIDFETDLDLFKSKLDEIKAIGGGDDAEDVAGGLNAGLNMNWRSNARYAILIADAPGHGNQYHDAEVQDDYGNGDPNGLVLEELMEKYVDNNINLCLTKIDEYTDIMFDRMMQAYKARSEKSQDKPKIEVINYDEEDSNMIDDKNKNQKEKKRTMGNLVAKTAIEIYNHYSQKAEKSANQGAK